MFDLRERCVYFAIDLDSVGSTVADLASSLSADLLYLTDHSDRYVDENLDERCASRFRERVARAPT